MQVDINNDDYRKVTTSELESAIKRIQDELQRRKQFAEPHH